MIQLYPNVLNSTSQQFITRAGLQYSVLLLHRKLVQLTTGSVLYATVQGYLGNKSDAANKDCSTAKMCFFVFAEEPYLHCTHF